MSEQKKSSEYVPLKRGIWKNKEYEMLNVVNSEFAYLKSPKSNGFTIDKVLATEIKPI